MAISITGKMNKAAHEFQAGESIGFGIRLGVQYYDRETKQKEWTNYECAVFAKKPQQIDFYRSALLEGAIVEVTGQQAKIRQFQGQNGLVVSIELLDARLGYIGFAGQPQQQQAPQQPQSNQPMQQPPHPQAAAPIQQYPGTRNHNSPGQANVAQNQQADDDFGDVPF